MLDSRRRLSFVQKNLLINERDDGDEGQLFFGRDGRRLYAFEFHFAGVDFRRSGDSPRRSVFGFARVNLFDEFVFADFFERIIKFARFLET